MSCSFYAIVNFESGIPDVCGRRWEVLEEKAFEEAKESFTERRHSIFL
jgi:hypothetical protein